MPLTQLVFLHGFGEDERVWSDFLPSFAGEISGICPAYATWTDCVTLADYARKIMASLPLNTPFVLVGHSMGGYIALEMAAQFPEKVKKVVMLHSTFTSDAAEKKINRDRTADLLSKKGTSFFIGPFLPNLFSTDFASSHPDLLSRLAARYRQLPAEGLIAATLAMKDRKDFTSFVQHTDIPFLFILGEEDALISVESIMQIVQKTVVILPKVGHQGTYEAPEACAQAIKNFLYV